MNGVHDNVVHDTGQGVFPQPGGSDGPTMVALEALKPASALAAPASTHHASISQGPSLLTLFCCCIYGRDSYMTEESHSPVLQAEHGAVRNLFGDGHYVEGYIKLAEINLKKNKPGYALACYAQALSRMKKEGYPQEEIDQVTATVLKLANETSMHSLAPDIRAGRNLGRSTTLIRFLIAEKRTDLVKVLVEEGYAKISSTVVKSELAEEYYTEVGFALIDAGEFALAAKVAGRMEEGAGADFKVHLYAKDEKQSDAVIGKNFKAKIIFNIFLDRATLSRQQEKIGESKRKGFGFVPRFLDPVMAASVAHCGREGLDKSTVELLDKLGASLEKTMQAGYQKIDAPKKRAEIFLNVLKDVGIIAFDVCTADHAMRIAMALEDDKTFSITLINTGEGLDLGGPQKDGRYQTFFRREQLPQQDLSDLENNSHFLTLVGMNIESKRVAAKVQDAYDSVTAIGDHYMLQGIAAATVKYSKDDEFYEKAQDRGTCIASSFYSMIRNRILIDATKNGVPLSEALMQWKLVKAHLSTHIWNRMSKDNNSKTVQGISTVAQERVEKTGRYLAYAEIAADDKKYGEFVQSAEDQLKKSPHAALFSNAIPQDPKSVAQRIAALRTLSDDLVHMWFLEELSGKTPIQQQPDALKPAVAQFQEGHQAEPETRLSKYVLNIIQVPRNNSTEDERIKQATAYSDQVHDILRH